MVIAVLSHAYGSWTGALYANLCRFEEAILAVGFFSLHEILIALPSLAEPLPVYLSFNLLTATLATFIW
jgi:hypothetical protein